MARPLRIEYNGAWYHVMNRGLERRIIFRNDQDRYTFLGLLKDITQIFGVEIHGFSLMDNHYHLLIHTPNAQLGRAMRHLNGLYTQRFNMSHRRDGPLFRGRYKAKLVDDNNYLTELLRYIHRNPVDARICKDARDHRWSSQRHYLKRIRGYSWLKTSRLLKLFGKDVNSAKKCLEDFVSQRVPDDILLEMQKSSLNIIGTDGFKEWVKDNFVEARHKKTREITKRDKELLPRLSAKDILKRVAFCYNIPMKQLRESQSGKKNLARSLAIFFLRQNKGMPLKEIARWMKTPNEYAAAQTLFRIKQQMQRDRKFKKLVREIERAVFY